MSSNQPNPTEATESRHLIRYAFELSRKLGIKRVLVLAHLLQDRKSVENHRENEILIWVARSGSVETDRKRGDACVEIPETSLGRIDQVKIGLILAVLQNIVGAAETVICLTGLAGSNRLDNLLITNLERDYPWFRHRDLMKVNSLLKSREFVRLLELAVRFANEGREGKAIGTIFILGAVKSIARHTRQLILNPLEGHPARVRSIHNPEFLETIRELAALDGGFIIDRKGAVARAGAYLDAPLTKKVKVAKGLGSRHTSTAALTAKVNCVGIVLSESSGTVSIFSQGSLVLEMERSRN